MTQGKQMMPQATRFAVCALALTAVLGTPVSAQSEASIKSSAPARPAAQKPAAPARANNTARPAAANKSAAARPNAGRPEAARKTAPSNTTHSNTAHSNTAHSNTAHESRPEARHEAAGRENRGGEHAARGAEHGRAPVKNPSYSKGGRGENLHGGKQIAADRFRGSFGRDHQFSIGHPVMIGGQASFQFGGLWFGIVDAWPAAWLYTDAVFVDFVDGGYVLVNVAHPEVTIAVSAGDPAPTTCATEAVPVAPVVTAPVVVAPVVVAVPTYRYFTWHYWRHYWL
jgi:hypothetical protein